MTYDPILNGMELNRRERRFGWEGALALVVLVLISTLISLEQMNFPSADFAAHARIASEFDFTDLHSITSRIAYPLWHLLVRTIQYLGVPLGEAATAVTAFFRGGTYLLTYWLLDAMSEGQARRWLVALIAFIANMVTCIWIPEISEFIYKNVGSPNVWHNPTQQTVQMAMMMVMPWLAHCWYAFERMLSEGKERVMLPWWKVLVLGVLGMGSCACKPTFMQALLPAAFVMYRVEVVRHPREWRYFGQIILGFLPAVGYFLLQYLYYTGVVVEHTSGVEVGIVWFSTNYYTRNCLMMTAAPLLAMLACWKKGMFKNRMLVLSLLMLVFSVLEAAAFRETGQRYGHGNFTWALNTSAFFYWAVVSGIFLRTFPQQLQKGLAWWRKILYGASAAFLLWHVYSGAAYIWILLFENRAF